MDIFKHDDNLGIYLMICWMIIINSDFGIYSKIFWIL